jgi:hypothetical protein
VAIVDRATAFDRDARYPDARAMLDELDGFIVGERATNKSDAPARRLAAWLAETWKDEREEPPIDEAIEGSHLVSFLDDGGLDAIGTGTERSMAATAAEEVAPASAPVPEAAPPVPATTPSGAKRLRWIPIAAVVIAGAAIAAVKLNRAAPPTVASAAPSDARLADAMMVDAERVVIAAAPDAAAPDAALAVVVDAAGEPHRPRPRPAIVITLPPPQTETHKVTITSRPWSYFTVDDAPLQHQTLEVLHLTSGAHVLHFTRDKLHKDVAIAVPADDTLTVVQDMSH